MDITLRFAHCRCEAAPISVLEYEEFPRVKTLILYVGIHDPEETHIRRQHRCAPSAKFFRPLVDGVSFPHLKNLEVRHHWATIPPANASLETDLRHHAYIMPQICFDQLGRLDGLEKLESIVLESPPELDSAVLMQLVGNPKAVASNLTVLDLRFCELDSETVAQLFYHAPPKLARLSVLCGYDNHESRDYQPDHSRRAVTPTHLCPLVREFGKRLVHLDFGAAHICRQLFFDEEEMRSLRECGIRTKLGANEDSDLENLDDYAVRQTIQHVRHRRHMAAREANLGQTLDTLHTSDQPPDLTTVSEDSLHNVDTDSEIQPKKYASLDEEEQQRRRLISRSNKKWFRRFIAWQGLCDLNDTWTEMMLAADMEELGVEWVLASTLIAYLATASHGTLADAISRQKSGCRQSTYQRRTSSHGRLYSGFTGKSPPWNSIGLARCSSRSPCTWYGPVIFHQTSRKVRLRDVWIRIYLSI